MISKLGSIHWNRFEEIMPKTILFGVTCTYNYYHVSVTRDKDLLVGDEWLASEFWKCVGKSSFEKRDKG